MGAHYMVKVGVVVLVIGIVGIEGFDYEGVP